MRDFNTFLKKIEEIGYVEEVMQYLVYVSGLPGAMPHEMILFETGEIGQVMSLSQKFAEILVFSTVPLKVGTKVARTGEFLEIPVGKDLLGHNINSLGQVIDGEGKVNRATDKKFPTDITPGGIKTRERITKPLETGITLVDLMIPLGKGQRELIIGDRKSGKTNFIAHTILNQAKKGTICIYAAIGKKKIDIKKIEEFFIRNKIMQNVIIVSSNPEDSSSIIYLTPYTAMTIAEFFRDEGTDTLIVMDDLSTHAKFYREIALLAKRFPGRNSYPGDVFHVHSKLLERAGNFIHDKNGPTSITCLPVVETTQGDLTGYIQTNIMSMTDGHIFFDSDLFSKGRRPAINPFLSVTRVGHQAQSQLRREINRELVSFLTLFDKVQNYVHFGAELSESIKMTLGTGDRILNLFDQPLYRTNPANLQVFLFCSLWVGVWNENTIEEMGKEIEKATEMYEKDQKVREEIDKFIEKYDSFNKLLGDIRQFAEKTLGKTPSKPIQAIPTQPASPTPAETKTEEKPKEKGFLGKIIEKIEHPKEELNKKEETPAENTAPQNPAPGEQKPKEEAPPTTQNPEIKTGTEEKKEEIKEPNPQVNEALKPLETIKEKKMNNILVGKVLETVRQKEYKQEKTEKMEDNHG